MRRTSLVVGVVAYALLAAPPTARVALVTATALSASGCSKCILEITTPDPLPEGRVGHAYYFRMQATKEGCDGAVSWFGEKDLPPGMELSEDGALHGKPMEAGTYSFEVTAFLFDITGWDEPPDVTRRYTLTIHPA